MNNISFKNDILPLKDKLYRLALRITLNTQDAEDAVQEAMIKIWQRRDRLAEVESLESWALTVVRNVAIDIQRHNDSHLTMDLDEPAIKSSSSTPFEQMMQKERIEMIRSIMDSLPEKQRTAMQLRDFECKSYKEIADIMQISEDQVKINIYRARQFVKLKIKNDGL